MSDEKQFVDAAEPRVSERPWRDLLRFIEAVSPFVNDVLDKPFPWKEGGQVTTWMTRAEYDEAVAALEALRD